MTKARPKSGQIVVVDWRDATPKEANKLRPAIVVEDDDLFPPQYPNIMLVPLTEDVGLAAPDLHVPLEPTRENGCTKKCYALSALLTATSMRRIKSTPAKITDSQLHQIRRQIAYALGIDE